MIGRGFSYKLLQAVAGMDDAPLEAALEKLSDADIVLVRRRTAGKRISLQACAHSGRGLRESAEEPAPGLCIAASLRLCAIASPTRLQPSRNCWRIISRKPA